MRRRMWIVLGLTALLVLWSTSNDPADSTGTLVGIILGSFVIVYLTVDYAPRKVRAWRAAD